MKPVTKSSPNTQLPIGANGLLTHCPLRHVLPDAHKVPGKAGTAI